MDGATAKTGLTVYVTIERVADGYYWTGAAWQAAHVELLMTERAGDTHKAGTYQYAFVTPTTAGVFDWQVTYSGVINRAFAARIDTLLLSKPLPELPVALSPVEPTRDQALMLAYMHLRNETSSGGGTGTEKLQIRNDAGNVIMKGDESWSGGTFTKSKLVAGP